MIRFTKSGLEKIKKDITILIKDRPKAVADLKKSRDMGDLSENGYYKSAKSKLSSIDYQLRKLYYQIKNATVVQGNNKDYVEIGSSVTLKNEYREVTYNLVGDLEADPREHKISLLSPIGRALENKEIGSRIEIVTPKGKIYYKLIKIT